MEVLYEFENSFSLDCTNRELCFLYSGLRSEHDKRGELARFKDGEA